MPPRGVHLLDFGRKPLARKLVAHVLHAGCPDEDCT